MNSSASQSKGARPARGRARVSGKTSLTRLSIAGAVVTIPHERDERGRVYALVGAYSDLPELDHNRQRNRRMKP